MKKLGYVYIVIAFFSGLFFYGQSRYECIKEVGFIEGYFSGCDSLAATIALHGEPSLMISQLKGAVWPYYFFYKTEESSTPNSNYSPEDIAKIMVKEENKRSGRKIDDLLTFDKAELEGKLITLAYSVDNRTMEAMRQPYNKKIVFENQIQNFCKNDGSKSFKYIKLLLNEGYQFNILYQSSNDYINLPITHCV